VPVNFTQVVVKGGLVIVQSRRFGWALMTVYRR